MIQYIAVPIYSALNRVRGSSQTLMDKRYVVAVMALGFGMVSPWAWSVPVFIATYGALLTGMGLYFPTLLPRWQDAERLDFLLVPFFGHDPRVGEPYQDRNGYLVLPNYEVQAYGLRKLYWRCFTGMSLTGLVVTAPLGIATLNPYVAMLGLLKGPVYFGINAMTDKLPIEKAEIAFGAVLGLALAVVLGGMM